MQNNIIKCKQPIINKYINLRYPIRSFQTSVLSKRRVSLGNGPKKHIRRFKQDKFDVLLQTSDSQRGACAPLGGNSIIMGGQYEKNCNTNIFFTLPYMGGNLQGKIVIITQLTQHNSLCNLVKSSSINVFSKRIFKQFCNDQSTDYVRIILQTDVKWLSKWNFLKILMKLHDIFSELLDDKPHMTQVLTVNDNTLFSYLADVLKCRTT